MEKEISRALRPFQKKLAAEAALRAVCVSGLFALPVWLALALARRCFSGAVGRPEALMLPVWALLAAALYALRYRPTQKRLAARLDALCGMDRVATAMEFSGDSGVLCRLQREDTADRLKKTDVRALPMRWPKKALAACCVLAAMLAAVPLLPEAAVERVRALVAADGTVRTDELDALVSGWAGQYGTYNTPYRFDSYVKGVTPIDFIPCDYRIDEAGVKKQLLQAICAMEPCTITAGLTCYRWGAPFDISLTHVEVDLDNQQLTFIKNGTVIVNTNIVTGMVGSHRTPIGLYEAHNKQTNCTLTGADYEVFVKYWVSVIGDSIGLHDASWRSVFGGDQYIFNGSHGCINIPEAAMVKIFNNIEDGTPVLIFGQNKWYQPGSADSPATKNPLRGTTAGK